MHILTKAQRKQAIENAQSQASKEEADYERRMDRMDNLYWSSME
jgi:hypothetical protein